MEPYRKHPRNKNTVTAKDTFHNKNYKLPGSEYTQQTESLHSMNKIQVIKNLRNGAGNVAARQSTCLQHRPGLGLIPSTAINQSMEQERLRDTKNRMES